MAAQEVVLGQIMVAVVAAVHLQLETMEHLQLVGQVAMALLLLSLAHR